MHLYQKISSLGAQPYVQSCNGHQHLGNPSHRWALCSEESPDAEIRSKEWEGEKGRRSGCGQALGQALEQTFPSHLQCTSSTSSLTPSNFTFQMCVGNGAETDQQNFLYIRRLLLRDLCFKRILAHLKDLIWESVLAGEWAELWPSSAGRCWGNAALLSVQFAGEAARALTGTFSSDGTSARRRMGDVLNPSPCGCCLNPKC